MKLKKIYKILIITIVIVCFSTGVSVYADDNEELALGALEDNSVPTYVKKELTSKETLPTSVDLSSENSFPSIGNQGHMQSCCAWATTYYQFGYQVAKMHNWNSKYNSSLKFSPKFTYNIVNRGENTKTSINNYYPILKNHGAVRYNLFPTNANANSYDYSEFTKWYIGLSGLKTALQNRVSESHYNSFALLSNDTPITSPNSTSLNEIKDKLQSGHVLTFTTDFGHNNADWTYSTLSNGEKVCIQCVDTNNYYDGHAMAIVGYDDSIWYDYNGDGVMQSYEKGALKIANSHGTNYGNSGFMWVMYDALNKVSNYSVMNVQNRRSVINNYKYYYIEVEECDLELIVKVELKNSFRNQIYLKLGLPNTPGSITPLTYENTFLSYKGGGYPFGGNNSSIDTATFPFDFGTLINGPRVRRYYCISIRDKETNDPTTIGKILFEDKTGKTVHTDSVVKTIDNEEKKYYFKIGMMGDVDNNGLIEYADATMVQRHIAHLITLTSEELKVADVNGDGNISISDARNIQEMYDGDITEFANGMFAYLG